MTRHWKYRKDGSLRECCNPDLPHPGKIFYAGYWRTPKGRDAQRARSMAWNKRNWEKHLFYLRKSSRNRKNKKDEATIQELEAKLKCLLADLTP